MINPEQAGQEVADAMERERRLNVAASVMHHLTPLKIQRGELNAQELSAYNAAMSVLAEYLEHPTNGPLE